MRTISAPLRRWPNQQPLLFLALAAAAWFDLYQLLLPTSEALIATLRVDLDRRLGGALQFFYYTPKVLLLLTGIVFMILIVGYVFNAVL